MGTALKNRLPITVDQYVSFQGYPGLRDELIYGEIVISPQPKPNHQYIVKNIVRELSKAFADTLFFVDQNTNFKFTATNSMPAPDVFVIEKHVYLEAIEAGKYLESPPLLVVEVISPANRQKHVADKISLYLKSGIACIWIVRPKLQSVTIHSQTNPSGEEAGTAIPVPELSATLLTSSFFSLSLLKTTHAHRRKSTQPAP